MTLNINIKTISHDHLTRPCESSSCSADCSPPCSPCGTTCLSEREVLISQRIQVKHPGWVLQPLQFIHLHKNLILSLCRLGFMRSVAPSARWWDEGKNIFFYFSFPKGGIALQRILSSRIFLMWRGLWWKWWCVCFFLKVLGLHGWFKTRPVQRLWRGLPGHRNHNLHQISLELYLLSMIQSWQEPCMGACAPSLRPCQVA